jgi:hypothetical protein
MKEHPLSSVITAAAATLLSLVSPAQAMPTCGELTCHVETKCIFVDVECGQNEDGTPVFCKEQLCGEVDVCVQEVPCESQPGPVEEFPDFPEIPEFPDFPPGDPLPFE